MKKNIIIVGVLGLLLSSMRHRLHEMSKEEIEEMILESVSFIKLP